MAPIETQNISKHALHSAASHVPCPMPCLITPNRAAGAADVADFGLGRDVDFLSEISKCKSSLAEKT